jgi:hypothetical protein
LDFDGAVDIKPRNVYEFTFGGMRKPLLRGGVVDMSMEAVVRCGSVSGYVLRHLTYWIVVEEDTRVTGDAFHVEDNGFTGVVEAELHHAFCGLVMVTEDEYLRTGEVVYELTNLLIGSTCGEHYIAEVVDKIMPPYPLLPTLSHYAIHLSDIVERAVAVVDDVTMSKVCVGDYPGVHPTTSFHISRIALYVINAVRVNISITNITSIPNPTYAMRLAVMVWMFITLHLLV